MSRLWESGIDICAWSKKYIDLKPPYLMRQICVLQWEEIKTKKSGAMHLFFEGKGPKGWNKLGFCWTLISHQSFSFFPSTSVGALGLFTFPPQWTVHNIHAYIWVEGSCKYVPWHEESLENAHSVPLTSETQMCLLWNYVFHVFCLKDKK